MKRLRRRDRGSVSVELAVLVPALVAIPMLFVVIGRTGTAKVDLDAAAQYAARQISIARDPAAAVDAAQDDAEATLDVGSPSCRSWTFDATIDAELVTVEISCVVDLAAAAMLPVPANITLDATETSVIDRFRENSGEFGISEGSDAANPSAEGS